MTSDVLTQGQIYDAADAVISQRLSQIQGVGGVNVNGSALPAVRVEINPAVAVQVRHRPAGRARRHLQRQRQCAQGRDRIRPAALPDLHQRQCPRRRAPTATSSSPTATARRCAGRRGHGPGHAGWRDREHPHLRPVQRQARRVRHGVPAARRQHHPDDRRRQGGTAAAQELHRPEDRSGGHLRPLRSRFAPRCARWSRP